MHRRKVEPMAEVLEAPWAELVPDAPYPMTQEEYERLTEGSKGLELVNGRLVREVSNTVLHMLVSKRVFRALDAYAEQHGGFQAFGADGTYKLHIPGEADSTDLEPDASLVATARLPVFDDLRAWSIIADLAPDLAVEVASEGQTPKKMAVKVRRFLVAGVRLIWVVYPLRRQAEIWRPGDDVKPSAVLGMADWLDGYDVAPGLSVPIGPLFR